MSLQSLMGHTVWMECGSSATPLSPCPNTGATASCLLSSVSPSLCSGASCLPASPSATSGLWFPASRAAWLSHSVSAASTRSASRPSAILSLRPLARSSAVCASHCAKKSKNSHSSVYSMIGWSPVSFYTPQDQSWRHACSLTLLVLPSQHAVLHPPIFKPYALSPDVPGVPFGSRSSATAAAGGVVLWQPWQSWRPCASLWEKRAVGH